ncbi:MAG: hypothetical protein PHN45_00865 [Methylococcales bacterium]|nr:hypothetical protein [Methylococcales bacterium]
MKHLQLMRRDTSDESDDSSSSESESSDISSASQSPPHKRARTAAAAHDHHHHHHHHHHHDAHTSRPIPVQEPLTEVRKVVQAAASAIASDTRIKKPDVSVVHKTSRRLDKKQRRMLAIVAYYMQHSTKQKACGLCAGCRAKPCGECVNCKRNANMQPDTYKKGKKRCITLVCDRMKKNDVNGQVQSMLLKGESYHIRPELTRLEKSRMKWASTAYKYRGEERGEFAKRMRDTQLEQIGVVIKNFRKDLEMASPESAKVVHRFLEKKVKYVKAHTHESGNV